MANPRGGWDTFGTFRAKPKGGVLQKPEDGPFDFQNQAEWGGDTFSRNTLALVTQQELYPCMACMPCMATMACMKCMACMACMACMTYIPCMKTIRSLHMLGHVLDARSERGDLHLRRARVVLVQRVPARSERARTETHA